jgi:hypothetical protein
VDNRKSIEEVMQGLFKHLQRYGKDNRFIIFDGAIIKLASGFVLSSVWCVLSLNNLSSFPYLQKIVHQRNYG